MFEIVPVGAATGGECFLLKGTNRTALVDTGFAFCAQGVIKNLERALNGRKLDYILLTHSHYDHVSAAPYIKARWPEAITVASVYAKRVLQRPTAKRIIREMNQHAAKPHGVSNYPEPPTELIIDLAAEEGTLLDLGDMTLEVLETPGHTRCTIAFYSKEERLLLGSETFGTLGSSISDVIPCNLVGHQSTLDSIKKAADLAAEHVLIAHYGLVNAHEARSYFEASAKNVIRTKDLVVDGYKKGLDLDGLISLLKDTFYTEDLAAYQPEAAFLLNARYMISIILKEILGVDIH